MGQDYAEYSEEDKRYRWKHGKTPRYHEWINGNSNKRAKLRRIREKKLAEIYDNLGQPRWKHKKKNRLHYDKRETQERGKNSTEQHILARKHESEPATPRTNNADLLQSRREIKETNTCRLRHKGTTPPSGEINQIISRI